RAEGAAPVHGGISLGGLPPPPRAAEVTEPRLRDPMGTSNHWCRLSGRLAGIDKPFHGALGRRPNAVARGRRNRGLGPPILVHRASSLGARAVFPRPRLDRRENSVSAHGSWGK